MSTFWTQRGNNSFLFFSHNSWQLITRGSVQPESKYIDNNTSSVRPFWKMASRTPDSLGSATLTVNGKWICVWFGSLYILYEWKKGNLKYEAKMCNSSRIKDTLFAISFNYSIIQFAIQIFHFKNLQIKQLLFSIISILIILCTSNFILRIKSFS